MQAMEIKNVTKQYGKVKALDGVSLSFEMGKIYGLLGRNGAGKSTLINIIANRIFADSGEVVIDGIGAEENMEVHEKLYCMSERDLYNTSMRVRELFDWTGRFYDSFDTEAAYKTAQKFQLDVNKRFKALSKGYQSICKLVLALSTNVPYVIFDEPVLGLDANYRELFYQLLLKDYEEKGRTLIIATHLIEEVANLIEEVVVIEKGRILLAKTTEELMDTGYSVSGPAEAVEEYAENKNVIGQDELGGLKIVYIIGEREALPKNSPLQISGMNLQKLFVKITEKGGESDE